MDTRTLTTAGVEYRQDDNGVGVVSGPVVIYGDVARTRRGPELVHPGAFLGTTDPALPVNVQHGLQAAERIASVSDGLLTFRDTPTALNAFLRLPDTQMGRTAAAGVQAGQLRGWSAEFVPLIERAENGVNAVYRALLVGLGLVDVPAYPGSLVQLRQYEEGESVLISGPAGAGKTQRARFLQQEHGGMVSDFQQTYADLLGIERDPATGRYPPRRPEDRYIMSIVQEQRRVAVATAQARGMPIYFTNSLGEEGRRRALIQSLGPNAAEETIDPGEPEVVRRLSVNGRLSASMPRGYRPLVPPTRARISAALVPVKGAGMAVTLTVIQAAADRRLGDGVNAPAEPINGILTRYLAAATALVENYLIGGGKCAAIH